MLVLGSLPGEASLAARQYYAHPRNAFWRLVGTVLGEAQLHAWPYPERLQALRQGRIGLWDTIHSAERRGSLDAAIRAAEPNPLAELVAGLPQLCAVAFNGATAARIGRRALAGAPRTDLALIDLPSSSPAHAALSLADKQAIWLELGRHLR